MSHHTQRERFPRTLQEAFGPYSTWQPERRRRRGGMQVTLVVLLCLFLVVQTAKSLL